MKKTYAEEDIIVRSKNVAIYPGESEGDGGPVGCRLYTPSGSIMQSFRISEGAYVSTAEIVAIIESLKLVAGIPAQNIVISASL